MTTYALTIEDAPKAADQEANWLFIPGRSTKKLGYEVFSTLDDCPPGHQRFFMKKVLAG